jgi:pimeloyl-ACP methyl ester carboxylesterase
MPFAHTANARVHYTVEGNGPALMLLHGTGGDGFSHWGQLLRHLTPTHTVICPDYAGSGQTTDLNEALQLDELVAQVIAVADACGQTTVDLVGYSLGAVIAAALAARHPQRVRSLVLVAGFAGGTDSRSELQFGLWRELIASDHTLMARFILLTGCSPQWLSSQPTAVLEKRVAAIVKFTNWNGMARQADLDARVDIRAELAQIQARTRVIVGREDQMVPRALSQVLADEIPGATHSVIDAGHLIPMEQPVELARTILAFCAAPSPAHH